MLQGQEERGVTEDEMVGWHHRLNGHECEQTLGDGKGQGSLKSMGLKRVRHDLATEQQLIAALQFCVSLYGLPWCLRWKRICL